MSFDPRQSQPPRRYGDQWRPDQWQPDQHDPGDRYRRPAPPRQPQQHSRRPARQQASTGLVIGICAVLAVILAAGTYILGRDSAPSPAAAAAAGSAPAAPASQPETAAGIRVAATQFYALYAAGQWGAAWADLTPSAQATVPQATWTAVHQGCTSPSASLARVIKSVTVAGPVAAVTETVAGTLGSLGQVTDAWDYAGGRWGIQPAASSLAVYAHGSVAADIAAAKAAGDCKG